MSFVALVVALAISQTITDVRVEGNVRVSDDAVRAHAQVTGEAELPTAFRRLWDTGLFEDVRFDLEDSVLVIRVDEKPILATYRFEGEQVPEDELTAALALRPNQPFSEIDRRRVVELAQELVGDTVDVSATTDVANDRVSLVVRLTPVELETVQEIRFEGNEALSDDELRDAMQTKERGFTTWISGSDKLREAVLRADEAALEKLYASRGYLDARVGPIEPEAILIVPIVEGRRYELAALTIEPGSLLTQDIVSDWLPEPGTIYDGSVVDGVVARLERYYQTRGYPSVTVVRERDIVGSGSVAIRLRVDDGPFLRVGRITFRGNERHRDRDLRQFLDLDESERFNQALVERGVQSLVRLETVAAVIPEVDFSAVPGRADITYRVREVDRFEYLVGGGVNGVQGASGNGQFIAKSLLGRGDVWRFDVDLGNRFQNFAASYRDPSTLGRRLFFTVDFARADIVFPDDTSEDTLNFAVRVGGPQGRSWQFLAGYRFADFTLGTDLDEFIPFLTPFLGERFRTHRANVTLAFENRNQPVFPTRGTGMQLGAEVVAGDAELTRARAQVSQLVSLSRRHVLTFAARAEAVWPFGKSDVDGLPRFERLFLGSENDLRGFAIRGVGPRDANNVVGGDRLAYGSAEYQFVAHPRVRLVGFFDVGNVWARDFDGESLPNVRYDAGAEIQFLLPVWNLPLRAGYGFNLNPVLDEDDGRFFFTFSVGF